MSQHFEIVPFPTMRAPVETFDPIALERRVRTIRESEMFLQKWPPAPESDDDIRISWIALERQLYDLAGRPEYSSMVHGTVAALRQGGSDKPQELMLREILCLAWTLLDEES